MIESVVGFGPELNVQAFTELRAFQQRNIPKVKCRRVNSVASDYVVIRSELMVLEFSSLVASSIVFEKV